MAEIAHTPKGLLKHPLMFRSQHRQSGLAHLNNGDFADLRKVFAESEIACIDEFQQHCHCRAVDVAFVSKSIRCIGQIAVKLSEVPPYCVDILVALVSGTALYTIEEAGCVSSSICFESVRIIRIGSDDRLHES
jgi:hypothetical protein